MAKKTANDVDIEKIMKDIRTRISDKQASMETEEDIARILNMDPEEPVDKRAVRGDFWQALHKAQDPDAELQFVNLGSYLGKGTSFKHKVLRKIRKLFWPIARVFFNTGYLFSVQNDSIQLTHNLIYEITLLRMDNDRLRDGYQVLLHKIQQMEARQRELEKMIVKKSGKTRGKKG